MVNIRKQFATDKSREIDGVWIEVAEGLELLLARYGNKRFQNALQRYGRKIRNRVRTGNVDVDEMRKITARAMSECVVLDWKNLTETDETGKDVPVEYSSEKAYEYLTTMPDFYDLVVELSSDMEAYREETLAESEGNS